MVILLEFLNSNPDGRQVPEGMGECALQLLVRFLVSLSLSLCLHLRTSCFAFLLGDTCAGWCGVDLDCSVPRLTVVAWQFKQFGIKIGTLFTSY